MVDCACAGSRIQEYQEAIISGMHKKFGKQDLKDLEDEAEGKTGNSGKSCSVYMLSVSEIVNSHCNDLRPTHMILFPHPIIAQNA